MSSDPEEKSGSNKGTSTGDFNKFKVLLLGEEQQRLEHIEHRLDNSERRAKETGEVLANSFRTRDPDDEQMSQALSPFVERSLGVAIQKDPAGVAEAIFPVLGPALRKAIRFALQDMFQSLNQTLDNAFSFRGVKWRIEAWRTGKSFAEITLLHTLVYRVEQVFLIHRETGLLLAHVTDESSNFQDPDQVSAMLSAIRDFASDSFGTSSCDGVEALQIGELNVVVEEGPLAVVAAVVRGNPPTALRECLRRNLETIHLVLREALRNFNGEIEPFQSDLPLLQDCIMGKYRTPPCRASIVFVLLAGTALALFLFLGYSWLQHGHRCRSFVERLQSEPGISVSEWHRSGMSGLSVSGLRDPLTPNPEILLQEYNLKPERTDMTWELIFSTDPRLVLERAQNVLQPQASVILSLQDGVLSAEGSAQRQWIHDTEVTARLIPGVIHIDMSRVLDLSAIQQIQDANLRFPSNSSRILPNQESLLESLIQNLDSLETFAAVTGKNVTVFVIGFTDDKGSRKHNLDLSNERAQEALSLLGTDRFPHLDFETRGSGPQERSALYKEDAVKSLFRCVRFKVVLEGSL